MPRTRLTIKVIEGLKGRPAGSNSNQPLIYFDPTLPGFGVSVSSKTGLKTYVVQRDVGGKTIRRAIGLVGTEIKTLEEARAKAGDIIHGLRHGIDPKTTAKGDATLSMAKEAYLAARPNLAEKSKRDYARTFDTYLSDWRDKKLTEITREMVEERHIALGKEYGHATANGVMRTLRAVFNFSIDRFAGVTANPVKLAKSQWFWVPRRTRKVSADNAAKFYKAVQELPNPVARDYLKLLLFTGLRREEAAGLTWHDIDFSAKLILIPASRTKAKRKLDLPMTDVVHNMLKKRRELGDAHFVFPASSKTGHISEPKYPLSLIEDATGIEISAHDLRRTFANAAIAAGVHAIHLKALLNHSIGEGDVTAGYIDLTENDLREPAQKVVDQLKQWCKIRK
jgi:integrase